MHCVRNFVKRPGVSLLKKVKRVAAASRRPDQSKWKNALFPRKLGAYGLKRGAFQTENALVTKVAGIANRGKIT